MCVWVRANIAAVAEAGGAAIARWFSVVITLLHSTVCYGLLEKGPLDAGGLCRKNKYCCICNFILLRVAYAISYVKLYDSFMYINFETISHFSLSLKQTHTHRS